MQNKLSKNDDWFWVFKQHKHIDLLWITEHYPASEPIGWSDLPSDPDNPISIEGFIIHTIIIC